jgi:hypothetical protein
VGSIADPLNPFKITKDNEKLLIMRERERESNRLMILKKKASALSNLNDTSLVSITS